MSPEISTIAEASAAFPRHSEPSLIERPDGSILLAWQEFVASDKGGEDDAPDRISTLTSFDEGRTWQDHRILIETPPGDVNVYSPSFLRLPNQDLLLFYFRYHIFEKGQRPLTTCHVLISQDDGSTFAKHATPWSNQPYGSASHVVKALSSGRLLLPVCRQTGQDWTPSDHYQGGCLWSDDQGLTWSESADWLELPLRGVMETHVEQMADGSVLMVMRTQLGAVFQSVSTDEGETWSKPQTTGLRSPESCPEITKVPATGDVMITWNNAPYDPGAGHFGRRTPLSVALSTDSGKSWGPAKDLAADPQRGYSNPACLFLRSGTVLVAYFDLAYLPNREMDCERIHLSLARFSTAWLYAPTSIR